MRQRRVNLHEPPRPRNPDTTRQPQNHCKHKHPSACRKHTKNRTNTNGPEPPNTDTKHNHKTRKHTHRHHRNAHQSTRQRKTTRTGTRHQTPSRIHGHETQPRNTTTRAEPTPSHADPRATPFLLDKFIQTGPITRQSTTKAPNTRRGTPPGAPQYVSSPESGDASQRPVPP